jgi:hypothetical protein
MTVQFDVSVRSPIAVEGGISLSALKALPLNLKNKTITIQPLNIEPVQGVEEPDYGYLTDLRIWIADPETNIPTGTIISREVEMELEELLVEAVRRFTNLAMSKTNQWNLDSLHPIRSYTVAYLRGDNPPQRHFPEPKGMRRIPKDSSTSTFNVNDFSGEITIAIWDEVAQTLQNYKPLSLYKELLLDAKAFRFALRHDAALLFAAFAMELLLESILEQNWKQKGLGSDEWKAIVVAIKEHKAKNLQSLAQVFLPHAPVNWKGIEKTFQRRNGLAHGKNKPTMEDAKQAIFLAESLEGVLEAVGK